MNELNNTIVPIPQKRNYIDHLINAGYTITICMPDSKIPFYKNWQTSYIEPHQKEEIKELLEKYNYDLNYGILTGVPNYNNVSCIDFDTKQFVETEQTKLINHINNLLKTDYIQSLIQSKKLFVEKSVNNGYHFVVSISDLEERKGIKLLDYNGTLKPNNLIKTEHKGLGEFLETRGKKQHFISFPSNGYSKIQNVLWELVKLNTEEYNTFENYVINYFLNTSPDFLKSGDKSNMVTSKKIRVPKTERNVSTVFDVVIEELKKFQSVFAKSEKDINIISDLLQNNGYGLIDSNDEYIYYIHPNSTKAEPNLALSKLNHCITNFSGNNDQFPLTKSVGTLTGFYILLGKKHSVSEIIQMLRQDYNIKLVRTVEEILQDAQTNNKQNNN